MRNRERNGDSGLDEGHSGRQSGDVFALMNRGIASSQDLNVRPLFKMGQRVRARNISPE